MIRSGVGVPPYDENGYRKKRKRRRRWRPGCLIVYLGIFLVALISGFRLMQHLAGPPAEEKYERITVEDLPQNVQDILPDSLKELLEKNPETADFVKNYDPKRSPAGDIDLSGDYTKGEIPLLLQWDMRWGYEIYGSDMMAITGCGPTCLSMVYIGLTGDTSMTPLKVARFSEQNGYYADGAGSTWTLMSDGAAQLGLSAQQLPLVDGTIISELNAGNPVVCVVGAGDFTTTGHFIVLTSVNSDGTISLLDPNSNIRSDQSWELPTLTKQIKNLWSITYGK